MPATEEEWEGVSNMFEQLWNFPHCLGAIDGKHVEIIKPPRSGSYYYNYKHTFSVVLLALVNAQCEFIMVNVGTNGRVSDGGVFANTTFSNKLKNNTLRIPEPSPLPGTNDPVPYVFVADDAFPLQENLMKPYGHPDLNKEQQTYNYRVSRARCVVERTFGIMACRFRILLTTINLSPRKVCKIVLACCYLHNYLRQREVAEYWEGTCRPGSTAYIPLAPTNINSSSSAKEVRDKYCRYFNGEGFVISRD